MPAEAPAARQGRDPAELAARLEKMMARESGPFPKHEIALLNGLSVGEIEGQSAPKAECKKDADGFDVCGFDADMGKDDDGDQNLIFCDVTTKLEAYGTTVKNLLSGASLMETPKLEVKTLGEGIAAIFEANFSLETQAGVSIGTMKYAALYAHGFQASCLDRGTGGRKTFTRVVEAYFQSLKFKDSPARPVMFAHGYRERSGDRTSGFRYTCIGKDAEGDPRFVELGVSFSLNTDGKTWSVFDAGIEAVRDKKGAIQTMRQSIWVDGKGPAILSAKPSEAGKFRIKFEAGARSDALESTPQAPLNTELWSAPELAKVATGTLPKYRYAHLDFHDDDPAFRYTTLTRSKPGVLLEQIESPEPRKASADPGEAARLQNKLEVDARGFVTKQVSSDFVFELVYSWGELPSAGRPGKGASSP